MLTVTSGAGMRLLGKLAHKGATDDVAMRFKRRPGGWTLGLDHARASDTAIMHEGRLVLLLDEQVSRAMSDRTLDVTDTEAGPRLTLR
jgi:hypothetical protein